jgi:hypothetical protein
LTLSLAGCIFALAGLAWTWQDEVVRTVDDYLQDVIPRVYMPVMRELLTGEELTSVKLSIREFPDGAPQTGDTPIGEYDWTLFLEVHGETLFEPLFEPNTDEEIRARFYSDLQDWISETTFGWGQFRGHM